MPEQGVASGMMMLPQFQGGSGGSRVLGPINMSNARTLSPQSSLSCDGALQVLSGTSSENAIKLANAGRYTRCCGIEYIFLIPFCRVMEAIRQGKCAVQCAL
jgi:hypothetical protein